MYKDKVSFNSYIEVLIIYIYFEILIPVITNKT